MTIPTMPVANFIMVQTAFALSFFKALFNGVASRGHLGQCQQVALGRCIREIVSNVCRVSSRTSSQEPSVATGQLLLVLNNALARPVIDARTLLPFSNLQALPLACGPGGDQHRDRDGTGSSHDLFFDWLASIAAPFRHSHLGTLSPNGEMRPHRQHIVATTLGNGIAHLRRIAIDLIARHPTHGHAHRPSMSQHLHRLLRLALEDHARRYFRLHSTLWRTRPAFRQVQTPVQKHMSMYSCIAQKRADLTVLALASRAAVLPLDTDRLVAFLD